MASPNLLSGAVMDLAAARLNDVGKSVYTYAVQVPFLNLALLELQEIYESNNVPVTDQTSAIIEVDAASPGIVNIPYDDGVLTGVPGFLPDDLIEIKVAWQSTRGLNQWSRFTPSDYLPQTNTQISSFTTYQWAHNCMRVLAANADNDIKLDYIRSLFTTVTDETSDILVTNAMTYLANRTASFVATDIEENSERASNLYNDAIAGLDRGLNITTKGRQKIQIRRQPFRASFKARNSHL